MNRFKIISSAASFATCFMLMSGFAFAQQSADIEAVKAANTKFYSTLSTRDAKAMVGLWANKPYVINIGPRSKTIETGYAEAVTKYWENAFANVFLELNAAMTSISQVQTNGKIAWVVGTEHATGKNKAGEPFAFDAFATNIFEKDGDSWLLVSHHAGIQPK